MQKQGLKIKLELLLQITYFDFWESLDKEKIYRKGYIFVSRIYILLFFLPVNLDFFSITRPFFFRLSFSLPYFI